MRCSPLSLLHLSVMILLTSTDASLSSLSNHDQHESATDSHRELAPSWDIPEKDAVVRVAAPNRSKSHPWPKRDILDASDQPSAALSQRHNHIMHHLQFHTRGSSLAKRNLAGDLTVMGFQLIWDNADVIFSSSLAHWRMTEFYKNLSTLAGGDLRLARAELTHIINYGSFRLTFTPVAHAGFRIAEELAQVFPHGVGEFIAIFSDLMVLLAAVVVFAAFNILAFCLGMSIWITMIVIANAPLPNMITGT